MKFPTYPRTTEEDLQRETLCHIMRLSHLLQKYDKRNQGIHPVSSGGLQQYVNRINYTAVHAPPSKRCFFESLPDNVILKIFSYLSAEDLCNITQVSPHWYRVANDEVFWRKKLLCDMHLWDSLGHDSNPLLFNFCNSDLSSKEIYVKCSPEMSRLRHSVTVPSLKTYLLSFLPRKVPRLAMLGPGLDSDTSLLMERLMLDETVFSTVRMFPGLSGGMGTGFTYKMATSNGIYYFDLTTIFSTTREERNHRLQEGHRLSCSKLFAPSDTGVLELTRTARDLCLSLDGLIYVVDSNASKTEMADARTELYALTQQFWAKPRVPILVLSCKDFEGTPRFHSCLDVVLLLGLKQLNGAWRVHNITANNLAGMAGAFTWIIDFCNSV